MTRQEDHTVMLSPFVALRVNSAKHLDTHRDRPFAAAQGDIVKRLRLMLIGRNSLRPYRSPRRMESRKERGGQCAINCCQKRRMRSRSGACSGLRRYGSLAQRFAARELDNSMSLVSLRSAMRNSG